MKTPRDTSNMTCGCIVAFVLGCYVLFYFGSVHFWTWFEGRDWSCGHSNG